MARREIGQRIGAVIGRVPAQQVVELAGYGVYEGVHVPPAPVGMVRSLTGCSTWDEVKAFYDELGMPGYEPPTNPRLRLDDGSTVWGAEVWWGSEDQVRENVQAWEREGLDVRIVAIKQVRERAGYSL